MDIASTRLHAQQIGGTQFGMPQEIVRWLGAVQAQDYAMAKWAIGCRLPGITDKAIENAIEQGSILRTHVLRPTWHFVAATDIHWMLRLSAPNILRSMHTRLRELELTERSIAKSLRIIEKELKGGRHLTREELAAALEQNGLSFKGQQTAYCMAVAELEGLICSGAAKGIKQTYALLLERVEKPVTVTHEQALERLARTYFTGHAPATLADFTWWSGLGAGDARKALEAIQNDFVSETIGAHTYWLPGDFKGFDARPSAFLLPAFDEFLIAYKTRDVTIAADLQPKAFTNNGIFRPTIVVNGQTTGIWKRTVKKDGVHIETEFFKKPPQTALPKIKKAAAAYGIFLEKDVRLQGVTDRVPRTDH